MILVIYMNQDVMVKCFWGFSQLIHKEGYFFSLGLLQLIHSDKGGVALLMTVHLRF